MQVRMDPLARAGIATVILFMMSSALAETTFHAKIFASEKAANKDAPLFTYSEDVTHHAADVEAKRTYLDSSGQPVVIETLLTMGLPGAATVESYHLEQRQLQIDGGVEWVDGKVHFRLSKDGKTETAEEKIKGPLLVGPFVVEFLKQHWSALTKGDTISGRYAVVDRLETIGFDFRKENDATVDGQPAVVIKMSPSSFLVAAMVKPLHFYLTPSGDRLIQVLGRTVVRRKVADHYQELDTKITFDFGSPH